MKISELVEALEALKEKRGDLEILVHDNEWDSNYHPCVSVVGNKVIFEISSEDSLP